MKDLSLLFHLLLLVAFSAPALGFSPQFRQKYLTRRYDAVKDVQNLLRDANAFARDWLPDLSPEELNQLVEIDYDAIQDSLQSSDTVQVTYHRNWLSRKLFIGFEPTGKANGKGFVFYPGALVRAEAYAPMCRAIAEQGCHVALLTPPMLVSLADVDEADAPINYYGDQVQQWAISGHSMGGVVAAAYANKHAHDANNKLQAVILLASYPSALPDVITAGDLSDDSYDTTSIYGSVDGLTTQLFIQASKYLLPANAKFVCIEGGNHSQFYYGKHLQLGDNPATVSRAEQQHIVINAIGTILNNMVVARRREV